MDSLITFSLIGVLLWLAAIGWWWTARCWWRGASPLPPLPRDPVPWGLLDLVLVVLCLFGILISIVGLLTALKILPGAVPITELSPGQRALLMLAESLASLATMAVSLSLIRARLGASWPDLGVVRSRLSTDVKIGAVGFVMLAPAVYALQALLIQWFESRHPLVELLQEKPDAISVLVSVVAAVLIAPLVEEYFFRVLLQGWLEKVAVGNWEPASLLWGHEVRPVMAGSPATSKQEEAGAVGADEILPRLQPEPPRPAEAPDFVPGASPIGDAWAYAARGDSAGSQAGAADPPPPGKPTRTPIWPIAVSSLVFALLHVSHGPDWIPLLLLGCGLGYVYRQTHRLLPCVTIHFLLNASSMGMFLVNLFYAADA